jgi:Flp pilus assembly pilin Flp
MSGVFAILRRLRRDHRAVAAVEMALAAPLFLLLLMGLFDYAWQFYARAVLHGAVAQAGRSSSLEAYVANPQALDDRVAAQVRNVYSGASVEFDRLAFDRYELVGKPEPFTDVKQGNTPPNGRYDVGECFEDTNGNGVWDAESGKQGGGGADDVVRYTVTMKFDRVMPVWRMLNQPQQVTLSASTILRNQPYNAGSQISVMVNCG